MNPQAIWSSYLAVQAKLLKSDKADDVSWGREAALNRILSSDPRCDPSVSHGDIDRWVQSESRRERHRAKLRRIHMTHSEDVHSASEGAPQARLKLRAVKRLATAEEWMLLRARSDGWDYAEIAARTGMTTGTLRVRILRLRQRLSVALAA